MNFGNLTKNPLLLVGIAAAVYFLFIKKSPATTVVTEQPPHATGTDPAAALISAGTAAAMEALKFGSGKAKEALGVEGMGPVSLNGQMAACGALGDLGGSFYGSY